MRRRWTQPKLVVLMRGRPEEVLTQYCKLREEGSVGPLLYNNKCDEEHGGVCGACQAQAPT